MDGRFLSGPVGALGFAVGFVGVFFSSFVGSTMTVQAGVVELSGLVGYNRSELSETSVSRQNRYTGGLQFHFTKVSSIKFAYSISRTRVSQPTGISFAPTVNIEIEDKVFNVNWVQALVPGSFRIQPYLQVGFGRLWRSRTNEFPDLGLKSEASQRSETGVGGAGLRIGLTKRLNLKGEFTVLVPDFRFSQWKKNQYFSVGFSWFF